MKAVKTLLISIACVFLLGSSAGIGYEKFRQKKNSITIGDVSHEEIVILRAVYGQVRLVRELCRRDNMEPGEYLVFESGMIFPCREDSVWFGGNSADDRYAFYERFRTIDYVDALRADEKQRGWD